MDDAPTSASVGLMRRRPAATRISPRSTGSGRSRAAASCGLKIAEIGERSKGLRCQSRIEIPRSRVAAR